MALLRSLDEELAENAGELGQSIEWSAAEVAVRELIADATDRRVELRRRYEATTDDKVALKLSAEMRLLESTIARMLRQVSTEPPAKPSVASRKAQRAARARWGRSHERRAADGAD